MKTGPIRVVVVGGGFGRIHAAAVCDRPDAYELTGIAGRGGAASRELAEFQGVPYLELDRVAEFADVACVAVGSAISGGAGTEVAQRLLAEGVHVLQEHPLHPDELLACARTARQHGVQYRMNLHYRHVRPVRVFIEAARRLIGSSDALFVDAAAPVHVLHPLVDILAAALGGVRPWSWGEVTGKGPLRSLTGTFAGVPLTLRVQNQLDPLDRDNQALLWHRIALGTSAGVLTLADTHGPVLWSPRWHAARDEHGRLDLDGSAVTLTLPGGEPVSMGLATGEVWPEAVVAALDELVAGIGSDPLKQAQLDLTTARIWNDLTTRLGPPERITSHAPPRVELTPVTSYWEEAEFYDLVAASRDGSVAEVVKALAGVEPEDGPVVEIGAGTGLLTVAVAKALPSLRFVAAEPDPIMRAVLASKVVRDPDLRARVTVTDGAAPDLDLPARIGAALVCGVAGHLEPAQRQALWRRLRERLGSTGPLVVELLALPPGARFDRMRLGGPTRIGQDEVTWWLSAEPEPAGVAMTSTWEVARVGSVRREVTSRHLWRPLTLEDVASETGWKLDVLVPGGVDGAVPLGVLRSPAQEK